MTGGWPSCPNAVSRAREHEAEIIDGPLHNPLAHHREVWLRGPDGYTVVIAGA